MERAKKFPSVVAWAPAAPRVGPVLQQQRRSRRVLCRPPGLRPESGAVDVHRSCRLVGQAYRSAADQDTPRCSASTPSHKSRYGLLTGKLGVTGRHHGRCWPTGRARRWWRGAWKCAPKCSFATPFGTVKYVLAVLQAPWSPTKLPYNGS